VSTDRLSPLDASFLHIEDDVSHMHIASVAIFEGPQPSFADVVAMVDAKLDLVPRYRQVVKFVPFDIGRPVWADDPHFALEYHLRHTALPAPGARPSYASWWGASCPNASTAPNPSGRSGSSKGSKRAVGPCWPRRITPWSTGWPGRICWP